MPWKNGFVVRKWTLEICWAWQLAKYTPRYQADSTHFIEQPDTATSQHTFLYLEPKRKHADFFTFIAMSRNSSSEAKISTSDCSAKIDGADKMTSSAVRSSIMCLTSPHCHYIATACCLIVTVSSGRDWVRSCCFTWLHHMCARIHAS